MPHPDNYDPERFACRHGDEEYDRRRAEAEAAVAPLVADAKKLKAAAAVFIAAVEGMDFDNDEPVKGYDLDEILPRVQAAADIDLAAYEAGLIDNHMEME